MEEKNEVVNEEVTTPEGNQENVQEEHSQENTVQAGSKTDPNLLLRSLKEEREKRRVLEQEIENLKATSSIQNEDIFSDEGKLLKKQLDTTNARLASVTEELEKKEVIVNNPILKEAWEEFELYRTLPENKGLSLKTAAKAFMVENGLLEAKRTGLEPARNGGQRAKQSSEMTADDIANLRKTNWKAYQEGLRKGTLKFS